MRGLALLLALFLPATAAAQTMPGSPFGGSGGGGAAFNGGDVSGQTNICGPDNVTNVEIGSCSTDANAGADGTSVVIGNGATNAGAGGVIIGSLASKTGTAAGHIAIGRNITDTSTGVNIIAIGNTAGATGTAENSIILGATATTALSNVFIAGTVGGGFEINKVMFRGAAPAVSACGTSPSVATGSATSGFLTTGSGGVATSCTITFPTAYTTAPSCICNNEGALTNIRAVTTTTTLVCDVAAAADLTSKKINWICLGGS